MVEFASVKPAGEHIHDAARHSTFSGILRGSLPPLEFLPTPESTLNTYSG